MKLAMSNIAWLPEERLDAYAAMAEAGFCGLEIAPGLLFHDCDDPFLPDESKSKAALAEFGAHGLELVSMQSLLFGVQGAGLFEGDEARVALVKGMHRAIELAGRFGIPNLVFGSPAQRRVPAEMAMEQAISEAADVFAALGEKALVEGTRITIEANPAAYGTNFLNTLEEALAFIEHVDHPAIAPILDLGAMHMNASFDTVPEQLDALLPKLNHVHVSEPELAQAPADPNRLAPVLSVLETQGYDKAISIEMRRPEDALAGVKTSLAALRSSVRAAGVGGGYAHA